jgi:hypothetical protein
MDNLKTTERQLDLNNIAITTNFSFMDIWVGLSKYEKQQILIDEIDRDIFSWEELKEIYRRKIHTSAYTNTPTGYNQRS